MSKQAKSYVDSEAAFSKAAQLMPGRRLLRRCGPSRRWAGPRSSSRKPKAASLKDLDGNSYIDYVGSYGPLIAAMPTNGWWRRCPRPIGKGCSFGMP